MNENNGFIIINRKMLEWEWYQDTNTKTLFIHCLLKANWKNSKFQGIEIPRGSFVTSLQSLSEELSSRRSDANKVIFTIQNVRTALNHLISTGEITSKSYSKFRVITITNYEKYQDYNKVSNKQLTSSQQATNNVANNNRTIYKQSNKETNNNISTTTPTNGTNLFQFIEINFGRTLNPIEIEELSNWEDNELTRYVIKKAILANVYSIRYISKVLYTYKQKGIKTVVDAEKEYKQFEKERNSKSNKSKYKTSTERTQEVFDRFLAKGEN